MCGRCRVKLVQCRGGVGGRRSRAHVNRTQLHICWSGRRSRSNEGNFMEGRHRRMEGGWRAGAFEDDVRANVHVGGSISGAASVSPLSEKEGCLRRGGGLGGVVAGLCILGEPIFQCLGSASQGIQKFGRFVAGRCITCFLGWHGVAKRWALIALVRSDFSWGCPEWAWWSGAAFVGPYRDVPHRRPPLRRDSFNACGNCGA